MAFTEEFLSQDDVDALMRGMTGEPEQAKEEQADTGGIRTYNMATDERIVRSRMPTLDMINERFSRSFRTGIFNYMHRNVDISVDGMKISKYSDFVKNLVVPTNINLFQAKPLRGTFLVVLDAALVFNIVESMFGGTGKYHTRIEGRDFTNTEMRIIRGVLNIVTTEYVKAWAPVYKIDMEYVRSEMNSQFANVATPSEIVVTTTFSIEFGNTRSVMHICFPYSMLEPIRDILYSSMQSDHLTQDGKWVGLLSGQLKNATVDLAVKFGEHHTTLGELIKFKEGDIIPIEVSDLLEANVDGIPVFKGRHGMQERRYAIKMDHFLNFSEEELMMKGLKHV